MSAHMNKSATALRALSVLEVVGEAKKPVTVAEVAAGIQADRSTAYRMLMTLVEAGYVVKNPENKTYKLSYKVVSLCRHLLEDNNKTDLIRAHLHKLTTLSGESAQFSVLNNNHTVIIQCTKGQQLVSVNFNIGDSKPLHCTSIGKLLLAYQTDDYIDRVIAEGLPKFASKTITDSEQLKKELQLIHEQGYAYNDMELSDDMRCVAVPIFDADGYVDSGISLAGPQSRYSFEYLAELKDIAQGVARSLSTALAGLSL